MKVKAVSYQIFCDTPEQPGCHVIVEFNRHMNVMNMTDARIAAERAGWTTGKTDLCPVCKVRRAEG